MREDGARWCKQFIFEKKKKTILRRFKGIKNAGWYSLSFLILDALRKHARPLKSNFMVIGMVLFYIILWFSVNFGVKICVICDIVINFARKK